MRLNELQTSDVTHDTPYKYLYHLCDYQSYSYAINNNLLKPRVERHLSLTWDLNNNHIHGYQGYVFKFVLRGSKIARDFGIYDFDYHSRVSGSNEMVSLDEREVRVDAPAVDPLSDYLLGTILLVDIMSEAGIRTLLGTRNKKHTNDTVTPAISALKKQVIDWKKPVWKGNTRERLTEAEVNFLLRMDQLNREGFDYNESLRKLSSEFPVKDYDGNLISDISLYRRDKMKSVGDSINSHLANRPVDQINHLSTPKIIRNALHVLMHDDIADDLIGKAFSLNLFHPMVPPHVWASILKEANRSDFKEVFEVMEYHAGDLSRNISIYDKDNDGYRRHAPTHAHGWFE